MLQENATKMEEASQRTTRMQAQSRAEREVRMLMPWLHWLMLFPVSTKLFCFDRPWYGERGL